MKRQIPSELETESSLLYLDSPLISPSALPLSEVHLRDPLDFAAVDDACAEPGASPELLHQFLSYRSQHHKQHSLPFPVIPIMQTGLAAGGKDPAEDPEGGLNGAGGASSTTTAESPRQPSPKTHLTEEQKKANHIASEKKRRSNIREQYDKLAEMTPGMEGQGRSEGRVLEEVVKHGNVLKEERRRLIAQIEAKGGKVDPELKKL